MTMTLDFVEVESHDRRTRLASDWSRPLAPRLQTMLRLGRRPRLGRIALAR